MESKKLTRFEIIKLIRNGHQEEIPGGYNIKWVFENEPKVVFEGEVIKENITITRNNVPAPDKMSISIRYVPEIPRYNPDFYNVEEFGDVYLKVSLEIISLKFIYDLEKADIEPLFEWVRKYSEAVTGRCSVTKEELTFDMKAILQDMSIEIFNVALKDIDFEDLENIRGLATFELACEYFKIHQ